MFPNKNVNLSQFYSVPSSTHPHHGYPYSFYIEPNHALNIVPQSQKNTPASCLGDLLTNGSNMSKFGTTSGANYQECYQQHRVQQSEVVSLPKYFRCSLGEGPTRYRRERTVFTQNQLRVFEKRFETQKYLSTQERFELARNLGLSPLQVKTWFQNRRMKWKKTSKGQALQNGKANEIMREKAQPPHAKTANNQL